MSLIRRCASCDAPLDPYGREGGHAFCATCREDVAEHQFTRVAGDPLLSKHDRRAA